jgi:hypothetical protein
VVSAKSEPPLELHFHNRCWPVYQAVSDLRTPTPTPWTPPRVEELRIAGGFSQEEFAGRIQCKIDRLRRFLHGDETALGVSHLRLLHGLARQLKFQVENQLDWSDPRAFFCLQRHVRWSALDFGKNMGFSQTAVKSWIDNGVPRSRPNTWMKLSRLAAKTGFDSGTIVDDRCWTPELLAKAIEESGQTIVTWCALSRLTDMGIRNYRKGKAPITRAGAWGLTRAAALLKVTLPPVGRVPYSRPPQARHRPLKRRRRWSPEMIAKMGTMTDAALAKELGKRPAAVAKFRERLGITAFGAGRQSEGEKS